MDQMPDTLGESRTIPAEGDDRNLHVCKLRACCKRDDATMEPVEAVPLDFVRAVTVTTDIVAKANLPRMQIQFYQRILHGRPNAIVAAAVRRTGWQLLEDQRSKLRQREDEFVAWVLDSPPIRLSGAAAIFTAASTGIISSKPCVSWCGGNARNAVKALIVANEFLEAEV